MVLVILAAADHLGIAHASPDAYERVSGHSLRPTGAQGLARMGVDSYVIELLGRWGGQHRPQLHPGRDHFGVGVGGQVTCDGHRVG